MNAQGCRAARSLAPRRRLRHPPTHGELRAERRVRGGAGSDAAVTGSIAGRAVDVGERSGRPRRIRRPAPPPGAESDTTKASRLIKKKDVTLSFVAAP